MLAIRMQRTGRKGHAQFRIIVQDSRRTPTSGNYVALLGNYNPHTKELVIDKEKAAQFVQNGAQPSERVALLLKNEGVKLPEWVKLPTEKQRTTRNLEKLRKNQATEPVADGNVSEAVSDSTDADSTHDEAQSSTSSEADSAEAAVAAEAPQDEVAEATTETVVGETPVSEEMPSEVADAPAEEADSKDPEA